MTVDGGAILRLDSAGAAGALCQAAQDANIAFLVGFDLFTGVRESILQLPENAWRPALRQDGQERDGAQIAEITHIERLDLKPNSLVRERFVLHGLSVSAGWLLAR
jgi:hypothetical protein